MSDGDRAGEAEYCFEKHSTIFGCLEIATALSHVDAEVVLWEHFQEVEFIFRQAFQVEVLESFVSFVDPAAIEAFDLISYEYIEHMQGLGEMLGKGGGRSICVTWFMESIFVLDPFDRFVDISFKLISV